MAVAKADDLPRWDAEHFGRRDQAHLSRSSLSGRTEAGARTLSLTVARISGSGNRRAQGEQDGGDGTSQYPFLHVTLLS